MTTIIADPFVLMAASVFVGWLIGIAPMCIALLMARWEDRR